MVASPTAAASPGFTLSIGGRRWWNGLTAETTLTNTSGKDLSDWSVTFTSAHRPSGTPWGCSLTTVDLGGGLVQITLRGTGWGQTLKAGASLTVGFNASQGVSIGNSGSLSAEMLLAPGTVAQLQGAGGASTTPITPPVPPVPPVTPPPPAAPPELAVAVGGTIWWNGLTAELRLTNRSGRDLASWSHTFRSPHRITGTPWGATVSRVDLGNGLSEYTLRGSGYGAALKAGATVCVGFNASQGVAIGSSGSLTAELLQSPTGAVTPLPPSPPTPPTPPTPPVPPVVVPPTPPTPPTPPVEGVAEALRQSMLFYEAQRSGDLDEATNRIPWRGDSGLRDGRDGVYFGSRTAANLQQGLSLDLTGGYQDAGDHGKFGLPLAYTLSTLSWGGLAFARGYAAAGQTDELLGAVKWGTDYLLKAQGVDAAGTTTFFVAQVGNVAADHNLWSPPETQTIARPAMAVTPSKPGSDVAAGSAAALASASVLFRREGQVAYADTLLRRAESLYRFADTYRGRYSDSLPEMRDAYNSVSGYYDELSYGAAWLARAQEAAGGNGSAWREKALAVYRGNVGGLGRGWTMSWDDVSYGAAVLLAQDTGDQRLRDDVTGWLDSWVQGSNGVRITSGGLRFISPWGSLRYAANTAMAAGVVADSLIDPGGAYSRLARDTIGYILGGNPRQSSYVVGYGRNAPQQPHHRGASGVGWEGFRNGLPNVHTLHGALVGGPGSANDFDYADVRSDYQRNEVAIDYNAGFSGALAYLNQLPLA